MPTYFLTPANHPADLFTIEEAAQEARTSSKTIRRWVDSNLLPAKQSADRRWHIARIDLEVVLNSRPTKTA